MGKCQFCGESAGFLRTEHQNCRSRFESGKDDISSLVHGAIATNSNLSEVEAKLIDAAKEHFIDDQLYRTLLITCWESAVERAFDDGILSEYEESSLVRFKEHFRLSQDDLDQNGTYSKLVKGVILRDILDGKIPERMTVDFSLPFNFQKSEKLIWLFQDVDYYEQKTRREFVGGHHGLGVRVAKGLYYRAGAFKGVPVEKSETVHLDTGLLGVTNKHIYFAGDRKSFRIPFNKIVTFTPYSDGIGIQKDAASAKPQTFVTGDGWFTYNLVSNASQLS